ncbi:Phage integrase family protein [Vibrio palustris]|uniref:Phage integrase family protein n=1 Tax=Vibrio palustris TaxID=1918946 RepID=A0A1R4B8P8_9VIBR|nr:Phage integrase family protein [Vibrio palustris]
MASYTIETRKLKSGDLRDKTTVFVKQNPRIIHRESKTFKRKTLAKSFGVKRTSELEDQGVFGKDRSVPLGVLLDKFMGDRDLWDKTGRTKRYVLRLLRDCDIAKINSKEIRTSDLIEHCRNRRSGGAGPATINHDIAYLRSVMKKANPVFNIDANVSVFEEAVPVLIDMGLIGTSQKRTRRPTGEELEQLRQSLQRRQTHRPNGNVRIPYLDILDFSILTCMRIGEVCSLRWEDLNQAHKTITVRDRKDPRKKQGNHMIVSPAGRIV